MCPLWCLVILVGRRAVTAFVSVTQVSLLSEGSEPGSAQKGATQSSAVVARSPEERQALLMMPSSYRLVLQLNSVPKDSWDENQAEERLSWL